MTDRNRKTIARMIAEDRDPEEICESLVFDRQASATLYPALNCWLGRTFGDPKRYRNLRGEQIRQELRSTAFKVEDMFDCGEAVTAEFWSFLEEVPYDDIAELCRYAAEILLKPKKGRK